MLLPPLGVHYRRTNVSLKDLLDATFLKGGMNNLLMTIQLSHNSTSSSSLPAMSFARTKSTSQIYLGIFLSAPTTNISMNFSPTETNTANPLSTVTETTKFVSKPPLQGISTAIKNPSLWRFLQLFSVYPSHPSHHV